MLKILKLQIQFKQNINLSIDLKDVAKTTHMNKWAVFFNDSKKVFKYLFFTFLSLVLGLVAVKGFSVQANSKCIFENRFVASSKFTDFFERLKNLFVGNEKDKNQNREQSVYLGGYPLGFTLECDGVLIVAIGDVETENGAVRPSKNKNIREGDVLYSINGTIIKSATHLHGLLNSQKAFEIANIVIKRGKEIINETIVPVKEVPSNMYRLGFWIRDNAAGVGTLTYVRADNKRFGALGHPVQDVDTGKLLPVSGGNIYKCNIVGYNKGTRGNPGELRGLFLRTGATIGTLDNNNEYGVYGTISEEYVAKLGDPVKVAFRDQVKTGKAKILCTIDGTIPKEYDIEIVKLSHQSKSDKKSMVIKVVDKELISKTGGIVQGMSGSPIIQNGKLVGAVTHVFVSDPTKGFGVYIDWMIDN